MKGWIRSLASALTDAVLLVVGVFAGVFGGVFFGIAYFLAGVVDWTVGLVARLLGFQFSAREKLRRWSNRDADADGA